MLYQHVRAMEAVQNCQFVLTGTNAAQVQPLVGRDEKVFEIVDKEEDLGRIVEAIKHASRARPTR